VAAAATGATDPSVTTPVAAAAATPVVVAVVSSSAPTPVANAGVPSQPTLVVPFVEAVKLATGNPREWTVSQIIEWVGSFGGAYKTYSTTLADNGVNGAVLFAIFDHPNAEAMLRDDLKIVSILHRSRIAEEAIKLKSSPGKKNMLSVVIHSIPL
jgi:hypothetical protein